MALRRHSTYFPENASLMIKHIADQDVCPLHAHDFYEMVCVSSGSGMHVIDGISWPISCGSVFIVSPNEEHYFEKVEKLSLLNILIHPDFLTETLLTLLADFAPNKQFMATHQTIVHSAFYTNLLNEELNKDLAWRSIMLETLFTQLAVFLQRGHVSQTSHRCAKEDSIIYLLNYLHHNYANDQLSIDYLAQKFNIQKRMLERKVHSITALTPNDYITHVRLCHAMNLLVTSEQSITDIAYLCGFNDSNYFSHRFKLFFGMPPRTVRKYGLFPLINHRTALQS
ncbi:helix-turn-helix domain-containing protein [Kluyvera sichuanensis]|uniref:helix-turn-helix domain-containing protein n=1 Tax=Kluyvera sichuanensis TaxID=2725494 RepID=UPI0039F5410C